MNKYVEKKINKIYISIFKKVFNESKNSNFKLKNIDEIILRLENSKQFEKFSKKFAKELARYGLSQQKGLWKKYYYAAKKRKHIVLPKTFTEFQERQFKNATLHNFKMIKSIPEQIKSVYKYKYIKSLYNQVVNGNASRGSFERVLKESGAKRAKLIARTETAKLQTAIVENRATDLGSVCYRWVASNDKRTRQSHKDMNNVIVFWRNQSEKPILDNMQGNAGEFPNCRCSPALIFDEFDLQKSNYNVYDYRTHKIINMNKHKLLEAIKNGKL